MQLLSMVEILVEKLADYISGEFSIHQRVILCIEIIKACHRLTSLYHNPKSMLIHWEIQVLHDEQHPCEVISQMNTRVGIV